MSCSSRNRKTRHGLHSSFPAEASPEARCYEVNRQLSPLLRLPTELRLQIYRLVFGDRQIHIFYVPWRHKRRIQHSQACTEPIRGGFRYKVLREKHDPWEPEVKKLQSMNTRSLSPDMVDDSRITLLSAVCRQLYHETALLPHKTNSWSFENMYVMERYILRDNMMSRLQRRAIQTLYCNERLPKALERKFGGLKTIIWKDGSKLRRQDLSLFPEIPWKDRKELRGRTHRW